ncbi:hypothetical protein [Bacillus sp. SM2101]|uniref:hypothetical protein n=1 Tax=Bacillus sp. SM2101 TaxID=2805366 RepID=UPI001BDF45E2|nr:hypothetical protein [Bacillus sp. SM2101]
MESNNINLTNFNEQDLPKEDQKFSFAIDKNGEAINPMVVEQQDECNNVISFCCTSVVPDGFLLPTIDQLCISFDFSDLDCCLETFQSTGVVNNPCNGTLECPIDIEAVRLVGCARMHANFGELKPKKGITLNISNTPCTICCDTTTCVDQIIDFTCGQKPPCRDCFDITGFIPSIDLTTDPCGRQIVILKVDLVVDFTGCSPGE